MAGGLPIEGDQRLPTGPLPGAKSATNQAAADLQPSSIAAAGGTDAVTWKGPG